MKALYSSKVLLSRRLRFSRFPEDRDAKEMPVLRDLNSRSRRTGISFAGNDILSEKKPSAYYSFPPMLPKESLALYHSR
jgi:hypothetical protein